MVILGAGGYGRTVADVAAQMGRFEEIRFLDDHSDAPDIMGACCDFAQMIGDNTAFYPAFGNNEARMDWLHRLGEQACIDNYDFTIPMFREEFYTNYLEETDEGINSL